MISEVDLKKNEDSAALVLANTKDFDALTYDAAKAIQELCAAIRALGWQQLKTAPKDGTEIIYRHGDGIGRMSWQQDDCGHNWYDIDGDQIAYPRWWAPMPANPVS